MPLATGAAVACPDRPVVNLQAEGSAMYTLQALWTQARESLDVTTVVLNNASYAILHIELTGPARRPVRARGPCSTCPASTLAAMSRGMGVPATRATTAEELASQLRDGDRRARPPPHRSDGRTPLLEPSPRLRGRILARRGVIQSPCPGDGV